MDIREPKSKRIGNHIKPQQPFPILIESESGIPVESGLWPLYVGNFLGDCVAICNPVEITSLYSMGFFGKGSLSRGWPSFGVKRKGIPTVLKERQWQRRKAWIEKIKSAYGNLNKPVLVDTDKHPLKNYFENSLKEKSGPVEIVSEGEPAEVVSEGEGIASMEVDERSNHNDLKDYNNHNSGNNSYDYSKSHQNDKFYKKNLGIGSNEIPETYVNSEILVVADSDNEDIEKVIRDPQPHLENEDIKTVVETLILTLEEAFFLSYGLGCLQILDMSGKPIALKELWQTFCKAKPDFIELYIAYHYFRAKGWVVKTGYKFGGDFLLYKQGPPFYHASYIVIVERVDSQLNTHKSSLTWSKLHGLNRLAESSGKDIVICQVVFPDNLSPEDLNVPKSLNLFQVNELLIKRWVSSQERKEKEQS